MTIAGFDYFRFLKLEEQFFVAALAANRKNHGHCGFSLCISTGIREVRHIEGIYSQALNIQPPL